MKSNFVSTVKSSALLYCIIFTATTLVDSIWQLCRGQAVDSNYHIVNRAVVVFIAVITITLFNRFRLKSKILSHLASYVISMMTVFAYVWFTSFFDPLSPGAYQGIFVIYTLLTILLSVIIEIKERIKRKRQSITN